MANHSARHPGRALLALDRLEEVSGIDIKLRQKDHQETKTATQFGTSIVPRWTVKKGTMYEGKITIPPHSTVELPLDNLLQKTEEEQCRDCNAKRSTLLTKN